MRRVKKSRNGCARCKSKRVKCGEEKPHCTRCTRLGVRCPGYAQSLRWVTKYEQSSPAVPASISEVRTPSPAASATPSQLANQADALPDDSTFESTHEPAPLNFVLDGRTPLCDNLWDHPGHGSLPELTDLCSPSPMAAVSSFTHQRDTFHDFEQSEDAGVDLSHFLSLIGPMPSEEQVDNVYRDFSPSAIVRSYPPASHRPVPHDFMSISRPLNNPSWTLIEYYFKEVAALFSSYDSQMNPFRTTVSRLWGSSLAMCRTMQSMAAATLVTEFPQFGPMGRRMRDEAIDIITREEVIDDKSLLALLMLGQTASWHDPNDLGISFFNLLRKQLNTIASSSHSPGFGLPKNDSNNYRFFEEALIYWEMLLSFVADNDTMVLSDNSRTASSTGESFVLQRVPHPWTGIARDTQFTVHEVGQLVRRERKRIHSRRFTSQDDITRAQLAIEKARELEERLLGLAHPSEAEIVSPGDDDTPVWHLLTMAEAYRCVGLMQLYRVFPDLLHNRLPAPTSTSPQYPSNADPAPRDSFFPIDLDSMNLSAGFGDPSSTTGQNATRHNAPSPSTISSPHNLYRHSPHHIPSPPPPDTQQTLTPEALYSNWLTEFAVTTLSRLKTIPLESRTRCLQPFLLVASCSELRLPRLATNARNQPRSSEDYSEGGGNDNSNQTPTISMEAIEVSRTRKFILGRLTSFLHVLPPKPIHVCLKLVNEVWKRLDAGDDDAYWVDVMIEKGWETTMG
ncbi:Aflatoxin biosynthesis regulatory protein [Penicillium concentricum]|uniref:Aflatoxin biosynthesis regulatory protein n=1 Tax=Penicillium concentricum TaxID=293559 RepID=A0A9W9S937_9EURO|nr:Aflatoxin biosynthesis regulatory protein [Penicillium concentricum]KAJ5373877.1 Aflatoxin biosynthesis regulatory protein [Penicillium concentricum]